MATQIKTKYAGVTYIVVENDKIYYIRYRRGGREAKLIFEPVGKSSQGMTPAKANHIRAERIAGKEESNTERRAKRLIAKQSLENKYTLERLWQKYEQENAHKASIKGDKANVQRLEPLFNKQPSEISKQDIEALANSLKIQVSKQTGKPLSAQTQKHVLALLRRLLAYASDKELCEVPSFKIKMPNVDNQKTEYMTQEQEKKYLEALEDDPNQATANILKFIFYTGIRKSATLALKWVDINLEKGLVTLRSDNAKNDKTEIVPLSDKALAILRGLEQGASPYVFPNEKGEKRKDIRKFADKIKKQAGLDSDFRAVHGLRHNFASSLVNNGADLYSVQKLLTHSSPEMTQRYAHLQMDTLKKILNK